MDQKTYYKQVLEELNAELAHQKEFLANLKGWAKQCQSEGWKPNPYPELLQTAEVHKSNVEKAITEIKKQMK